MSESPRVVPRGLSAVVTALVVLASGCAHSILIPDSDPMYRRAIEHYRMTRQLVTQSLAPDTEQDTFMLAEGLYRYRFAAPSRTAGSYIAEIAASLIDLPALESLAGSLDLYSLRLKTNDGAVQLWESLLAHNASTPLAPLTLYRLGWAYRKSVVSGLPRTSDQAFDDLIKTHPESPLAALAIDAKKAPWKSPGTATAWSIIPGAGQMYACKYGSGALRMAIALAAATALVVPIVVAYERRDSLSWHHDWPLLVTGVAGGTVLTIDYTRSYEDALRSVIELDDRREAAFEGRHPEAP